MDQELKELEGYLERGDRDGVRALLKRFATKPLTPEEEGGRLVGVAALYLKIMNSINSMYLDELKEAMQDLETLQEEEKATDDDIKRQEVVARLKGRQT